MGMSDARTNPGTAWLERTAHSSPASGTFPWSVLYSHVLPCWVCDIKILLDDIIFVGSGEINAVFPRHRPTSRGRRVSGFQEISIRMNILSFTRTGSNDKWWTMPDGGRAGLFYSTGLRSSIGVSIHRTRSGTVPKLGVFGSLAFSDTY